MAKDEQTAQAAAKSAKPGRLARVGRGLVRGANWFVPLRTGAQVARDSAASVGRIGGAFAGLWQMLRHAWSLAATKPTDDDRAAVARTIATLTVRQREKIQKGARLHWLIGSGMLALGVVMLAGTLGGGLTGVQWLSSVVAWLLWVGFGAGYALRSAADYHAIDRGHLVRGLDVLRTPALWVPLPMSRQQD